MKIKGARFFLLICFFSFTSICLPFSAQAFQKQAETELLSSYDPATPDKEFYLGIKFKISPNWHIYWQYPGEFGLPTRIEFKLPVGYEVGELLWPAPEKFMQSADQLGYGYSNEVLLFSKVKPASGALPLKPEQITAEVKWLSCSPSLCVPGSAKHQLENFKGADASNDFNQWLKRVPLSATETSDVLKITQQNKKAGEQQISVSLIIDWAAEPGKIEFFPALPKDLKISEVFISQEGLQTLLSFNVSVLAGVLPAASKNFSALILPHINQPTQQVYSFEVKL